MLHSCLRARHRSIVWLFPILFIRSPRLGSLYFLAIVDNVAVSLRGQVSVQMSLFLWGHPWDGNCWVPCSSTFSLWRSCPLFPTVAAPLCTPPAFVLLPQQQRETHLYSPSQLRSLSRSCPKTSYLTQRQLQSPHLSPGGPFNLQALRGQGPPVVPHIYSRPLRAGLCSGHQGCVRPIRKEACSDPWKPQSGPFFMGSHQ